MNTKSLFSSLFVLVVVLGVVAAVNRVHGDFAGPTASFPSCASSVMGCNTPINVGTTDQVKQASLSVYGFLANQNARFKGAVEVDSLINSGNYNNTLCADPSGNIKLCTSLPTVQIIAGYGENLAVSGIAGFNQNPSPAMSGSSGGQFGQGGGGGQEVDGTHTPFVGQVYALVSGSTFTSGAQLALYKSGMMEKCWNITSAGGHTFPTIEFEQNDTIQVTATTGLSGCN